MEIFNQKMLGYILYMTVWHLAVIFWKALEWLKQVRHLDYLTQSYIYTNAIRKQKLQEILNLIIIMRMSKTAYKLSTEVNNPQSVYKSPYVPGYKSIIVFRFPFKNIWTITINCIFCRSPFVRVRVSEGTFIITIIYELKSIQIKLKFKLKT